MLRNLGNGNKQNKNFTKDSNKRRTETGRDSRLTFRTSCFHNVYLLVNSVPWSCVYI